MLRDAEHFNCVLANPAAPGCKGKGRDTPALGILRCRRAAKSERSCVEAAAQNSNKVIPKRGELPRHLALAPQFRERMVKT